MSIWVLMILIILAIIILIPYIIARKRKHQNQFAILGKVRISHMAQEHLLVTH